MGRLAHVSLSVLVAITIVCAGCGRPAPQPSPPATVLPDPASLPQLSVTPRWSIVVAQPVSVSVAADAGSVAGSSAGGPWAYDAAGDPLTLPGAVGGAVWALPDERTLVGPGAADPPGPVAVFSGGSRVWSGSAVGPVVAAADGGAGRAVVVDAGADSATELIFGSGGAVREIPLGAATSAQLDDAGDALVADSARATLFGPDGRPSWTEPLRASTPPRTYALDPQTGDVAVATSGSDHSLYGFSPPASGGTAPRLVWSQPLPAGGTERLVAGSAGQVAVWNVGSGRATLAAFDVSDGAPLWQDTLSQGDTGGPVITGAAFRAGGGMVLALDDCLGPGIPCAEYLDHAGLPVGVLPLSQGGQVVLAGDGRAAVVASPDGAAAERVAWWPLPGTA